MASWNGSLVVFGGAGVQLDSWTNTLNDVWLLDVETFVWTEYAPAGKCMNLPTMLRITL
jgi:hypothetical protein